jgi:alpha-mannosidase
MATTKLLKNDLLQVEFAPDGSLARIYDQEHRREVLEPGQHANQLAVYYDDGDAWDFSITYLERRPRYFELMQSSARVEGPHAIVEQEYRFGQSTLQQKIVLTQGSRRLDFITAIDWREDQKMLRTSFPVAVHADEVTCEIQFGNIKRPTHDNTSWDMAKYEICAQRWVDLSRPDYGVALLNDCKYGHCVLKNVLDLNLLRSPSYPDPTADRAQHEFTYALYPHAGDHITGNVVQAGYELNMPLRVVPGTLRQTLQPSYSFAEVTVPNVIIDTVKKAEESDDVILRLYECNGFEVYATISLASVPAAVWRTNLLEEPETQIDYRGNKVELKMGAFEIVTLLVKMK